MAEKIKQVKPEDLVGPLKSSSNIQRPLNPKFTSKNVPYPSMISYNAGVVKYQGQYVMVFRNDYNWNDEEQKAIGFQIGVAYSDDGITNWRVHPKPILEFQGGWDVRGSFDPRVTVLDGRIYITYCQFTGHGYLGRIAVTEDLDAVRPVLQAIGKKIVHCGPPGAGQGAKLVNQALVAIHTVATFEALLVGRKLGLDLATMVSILLSSSGGDWMLENHLRIKALGACRRKISLNRPRLPTPECTDAL